MKILVPYDFTAITRTALDHGLFLAKLADAKIELLHIVDKESKRADAEHNFKELLKQLAEEDQGIISSKVIVGDIFKDIAREGAEGDFQMLVMGTHGEKGLQKILGSNAIKVITSGDLPFLVTQSKGPADTIKRIVMPVNLTKESLQIVQFAANAAKRFDAEIHIVHQPETDEWLLKKMKINVAHANNYLNKEKVKHTVVNLPGKKSFADEVNDYGEQQGADLFAVAHFSESILPQFDRFSQELITNALQVPVLILSAKDVGRVQGQYTFIRM
ncbi:MAG: nucleotide-binding universal stress UspA family protein [Cryomorphaceae bacterium]|jgi:nucleotide-binding universal stress UspA family protein